MAGFPSQCAMWTGRGTTLARWAWCALLCQTFASPSPWAAKRGAGLGSRAAAPRMVAAAEPAAEPAGTDSATTEQPLEGHCPIETRANAFGLCPASHPEAQSAHSGTGKVRSQQDRPLEGHWSDDMRFIADGRDWDSVMQAMRAATDSDRPALPGDLREWSPQTLPVLQATGRARSRPGRITWALSISYFGPDFHGYAWQQALPTVQGCIEAALAPLVQGRNTVVLECAGRTDAGVSAVGQLVSFYAWADLDERELRSAINAICGLQLLCARKMPREFHATFSAHWRRYVYLLPVRSLAPSTGQGAGALRSVLAGADVSAEALHAQLQPLLGEERDYSALGRGLPKKKSTRCTLLAASARPVRLAYTGATDAGGGEMIGTEAVRIEVVADRFLRKQIRTLVGTAIIAARDCPDEPRELLARACGGRAEDTAPPAP
ncbi:pseudouridine synthase, partial [Pavlovales sp. CCMP2436]